MSRTKLSDEAQAFLLDLHSCAGTLPRSAIDDYCASDADHSSAPCPLLDAYHETMDWRKHLGISWDEWHETSCDIRATWLWHHLLFCFFRRHVNQVDPSTGALLVPGCLPYCWLMPSATLKSFAERDSLHSPLPKQWRPAPEPLRDIFKNARGFRWNHPFAFATYLHSIN